jgi:hypothetical protein
MSELDWSSSNLRSAGVISRSVSLKLLPAEVIAILFVREANELAFEATAACHPCMHFVKLSPYRLASAGLLIAARVSNCG